MRGDNHLSYGKRLPGIGSPPRAWGQPRNAIETCRRYRFTPTCVGTTIDFDVIDVFN